MAGRFHWSLYASRTSPKIWACDFFSHELGGVWAQDYKTHRVRTLPEHLEYVILKVNDCHTIAVILWDVQWEMSPTYHSLSAPSKDSLCNRHRHVTHTNRHQIPWKLNAQKGSSKVAVTMPLHKWQIWSHRASPVCHQVSTTVHLPSPTTWWYHRHASSFRGSPTAQEKGDH